MQIQRKISEDETSQARSAEAYRAEQARGSENKAKNAEALALASTQLDLTSGKINKLTADQRTAAAETALFNAEILALRQQLVDLNKDLTLTPEDRRTRALGLQNQISNLQGQHTAQLVQNQVQQARDTDTDGHVAREQADATAALTEAQRKNVFATQQAIVAHEAATGAITKEQAAQQLAAVHAGEFAGQLAKLQQDRADALKDPKLSEQEKQLAITKIDVQSTNVGGEAFRASLQDQWAEKEHTAVGGFISALDEMAVAGKDYAGQMRSLTTGILSDVNRTLVEALTTRSTTARNLLATLGRGVATKAVSTGLAAGEGAASSGILALLSHGQSSATSLAPGSTNTLCHSMSIDILPAFGAAGTA